MLIEGCSFQVISFLLTLALVYLFIRFRQRVNMNRAYNMEVHSVIIQENEMENVQSTVSLLNEMLRKQSLMNLPPYRPFLNINERKWKFFKKKVIYNSYYEIFTLFR